MNRFAKKTAHEPLRLRQLFLPVIGGILCLYFSYYLVAGRHGLAVFFENRLQVTALEKTLGTIVSTRKRLEHHVALLRPESIDPDLLDESARIALGYAREDELTIFQNLR